MAGQRPSSVLDLVWHADGMIDRPDAATLLDAMADALTDDVMPHCDGGVRHSARVVANLCRILAREQRLGDEASAATVADLGRLLAMSGDADALDTPRLPSLVERLDEVLAGADALPAGIHEALVDDVNRRLAIARPDYR